MSADINNLDKQVAVLNQKLDNLADKQAEMLLMLREHISEEQHRYDEIMDKKADMWVQKFAVGLISAICLAFIGGIVSLIWIK